MGKSGTNRLFMERSFVFIFMYLFFKTINLSEFEVPIDTQGSCPVSNQEREQGGKLGLELNLEVIHVDVIFKATVLSLTEGRVKR